MPKARIRPPLGNWRGMQADRPCIWLHKEFPDRDSPLAGSRDSGYRPRHTDAGIRAVRDDRGDSRASGRAMIPIGVVSMI